MTLIDKDKLTLYWSEIDPIINAQPEINAIPYEPSTRYEEFFVRLKAQADAINNPDMTVEELVEEHKAEIIRETMQAMKENGDCQWR